MLDTGEVNVNAVNENGEIPFTIAEGTVNYAIYKATGIESGRPRYWQQQQTDLTLFSNCCLRLARLT